MKKIFLITLIGISVFSYGQKTFKLCTIEERKLDTIANFFNVSTSEIIKRLQTLQYLYSWIIV